jgi:hypothetical protein
MTVQYLPWRATATPMRRWRAANTADRASQSPPTPLPMRVAAGTTSLAGVVPATAAGGNAEK